MKARIGLALSYWLLALAVARATVPADDLVVAIDTWNVNGLQAIAGEAGSSGRQRLASAMLDAFGGNDALAIDSLEQLTSSGQLEESLRFVAFRELGRLDLRSQRYVRASRAFAAALEAGGVAAGDREEVEDDLRYARAHLTVLPMTVVKHPGEPVPVIRDALELPRVTAELNGTRVDAILDTGASNSVVSASTARRLHLRAVKFGGGVASDGGAVAARFAVADNLSFAGHEFRNVPFIVLPDAAVAFPLGDGVIAKVEPILGLSVLRKLGRIEIRRDGDREMLREGGVATRLIPANVFLPRGMAIVRAFVGTNGEELRMSLDTGSNRTSLDPAAIEAHPGLASGAARERVGMASVAGLQSNDAGTLIPALDLKIGEVSIPLKRIPVGPGPARCDGTLGQDVFRSGAGYVIDFDRMTLEILPPPVGR